MEIVVPQETVEIELDSDALEEESEVPPEEENSGQLPIDVTPIPNAEVQKKKQQMKAEEDEIFKWVRATHHECLKT